MNNYCPKGLATLRSASDHLGFLTALTVMISAAPAMAAEHKVTNIELTPNSHQLELKLSTTSKVGQNASFYTVRQGNIIEANLLNTDLDLAVGDSFQQAEPMPGIKALEVNQVDQEHTQIIISTAGEVPIEHLLTQQGNELILSLNRVTKTQSLKRELKQLGQKTVNNIKQTYKSALGQAKTKEDHKSTVASSKSESKSATPDVLIPNPDILINDNRIDEIKEKVFQAQEDSETPATLPRAVAPPVGDMAVSNINTMPDMVDLGSTALVPRLVMRDAPVREVLSLLARSANLNVVYAAGENEAGADDEETGPTVSLDLENQPIQEVFNSVLLVSGLDANRRGNIIYVGEQLPAQARNLISRTLRLNQVTAENAALYLASQGAAGKRLTTEVEEIIDPDSGRVTQRNETSPELSDLDGGSDDETGTRALMLRGLQVSTDNRLNAITLVGEPRKVEVATAFLTQLDARRRQVAVNVKVVDVSLSNIDEFSSSFSFGVNDSFFVQDGGAASLRFGETSPVDSDDLDSPTGRVSNPPVITNPFSGANTFIDLDSSFEIPGTTPGLIEDGFRVQDRGTGTFFDRTAGVSGNPFDAGLTDFERAGFDIRTSSFNPETGITTIELTPGDDGSATSALPSLFQFPDKFLALLESKVTSGNAKILTDPTLMVQEGQQATVKLAQNVVESVKTEIDSESGFRTITPVIAEVGLLLTVNVERVDDNGFVSLSVSPTVSAPGLSQTFDSGGGAENIINLITRRELNSGLVRLRDGQSLILSGIIQDSEQTTIEKVPILGDIPLLGSLFRSSTNDTDRSEVIVLLTPEIVEEDAGLASNFSPGKESREVLQREGVGLLGN